MTPGRSAFVTAIAWIFIVLAGFSTLMSILQNIMVALVFPVAEMQEAASQVENLPGVPWFASWMFSHFQLFFLFFLVVSATTLTAAIGLLKRRNWARVLFVTLMAIGIAWNIAGVVLMFFLFWTFADMVPGENAGFMFKVMLAFNTFIVAAFVFLFSWIIKRLVSEEIRREFNSREASPA